MRISAPRAMRLTAYAVSAALAVSGSVLAVTPVQAAPPATDRIGVDHGVTWLTGELESSLIPSQYGGSDYGLSIDTALALLAVGGHDATAAAIADHIDASYMEYAYSYGGDDYTGRAANATAKAMVLAQTLSPARSRIGGIDLRDRLESMVVDSGPSAGRIVDVSTKNGAPDGQDYANTLGQAFAAAALHLAGSAETAAATDFLLAQQCPSGFFRLGFTPDRGATDQTCDEGAAGSEPDTDTTAIAVLNLAEQADGRADVGAAVQQARTWLRSQQKADGSFGGGPATEGSNANSTGLAGWALAGGSGSAEAARWLRDHQVSFLDVCGALVRERGAIAYDDAALALGRRDGITAETRDQFRRASAQALPALQHLAVDATPADPVLAGPSGYRKAGGRARLVTTGVGAGDGLCLNGPLVKRQGTATGPSWSTTVTLPRGTKAWKYAVRDADGHVGSTTVDVLGRKTLTLRTSSYRVRRGQRVTVVIRGLASGERARIYHDGDLVRSGTATGLGRFAATVRVDRRLGRHTIRGYGQFGDIRRGTAVVKVVR